MIKLCYKEYPYKLNLAACKAFYEQTGKDINYVLLGYLDALFDTKEMTDIKRLHHFLGVEDFHVVAKLLHCMIKQENKSIPLAEIEDGMFRVGWLPSDQDSDLCQPWPLMMVDIATQVNIYYSEMDKKKVVS